MNRTLSTRFSVTAHKKKVAAFLVSAAVVGGALMAYSNQPPPGGPTTGKSNARAGFSFTEDANVFAKSANNAGNRELFFNTMILVLLVLGLGVGAIYVSKRLLPRITNLPSKKVRIIETVHLGPRKAVHLLKIGNQGLLVGSTNESITMLANVTGALSEANVSEQEGGVGVAFDGAAEWDSHRMGARTGSS
ncbi:MAG: flagellar biosynthetic protein FliO [Planctomycetota bacterium]|jgi:flagellar biosynthetic protein FliO